MSLLNPDQFAPEASAGYALHGRSHRPHVSDQSSAEYALFRNDMQPDAPSGAKQTAMGGWSQKLRKHRGAGLGESSPTRTEGPEAPSLHRQEHSFHVPPDKFALYDKGRTVTEYLTPGATSPERLDRDLEHAADERLSYIQPYPSQDQRDGAIQMKKDHAAPLAKAQERRGVGELLRHPRLDAAAVWATGDPDWDNR